MAYVAECMQLITTYGELCKMCIRDSYYTPETKKKSKQRTTIDDPNPNKAKTVPSAGKIMMTFGTRVEHSSLVTVKTISGKCYVNLLQRLNDKIK